MIYEYENIHGERREIVASMKSPPPEMIRFDAKCLEEASGEKPWYPSNVSEFEDLYRIGLIHTCFRRVYTAGQPPIVKKYGVEYAGQALPVSRALPLDLTPGTVENRGGHTVLRHADGGYTDLKGRRIVASKADVERAEASTGMKRD